MIQQSNPDNAMQTVSIYFSKTDIEDEKDPTPININETGDVLKDYNLKSYTCREFRFFGFADDLANPKSELVLATMLIPKYFDQNALNKDIHGLFVLSVGIKDPKPANQGLSAKAFVDDKTVGQFGCPRRILKQADEKSYFTFNNMRFYPFVNTDFTVGYYICDHSAGKRPRLAWPNYEPIEDGVALEYPVQFDATLGLYMTRASHIAFPEQPS
jgi:hypothetical protein